MNKEQKIWIAATTATILIVAGSWIGWTMWVNANSVDNFLQKDISSATDKDLGDEIRRMNLTRASADQRRAVFEKLFARVKAMSMQDQLAFINMGRLILTNEVGTQAERNAKILVLEFWSKQARDYQAMSPEERKALMDKRIAQEQALEAARQAKRLADRLTGKAVESADARAARHAGEILQAATEAYKSANTSDRAAAAEFYTDLQKRRSQLGLPSEF